jgi:hypothetical protein
MSTNKAFNMAAVLALALLIGIMSWNDMHPKIQAGHGSQARTFAYHAGLDITSPKMVPEDNLPLTIEQGTFSYTKGKTEFTHEGMAPVTFAQRQVSLLFRFTGLPSDASDAIKGIKDQITAWQHQGTDIVILFIDYRPTNPDFKAYAALLAELHKAFKTTDPLVAVADPSWLQNPEQSFGLLQDNVSSFLLPLPEKPLSADTMMKLRSLKYNFIALVPEGNAATLDALDNLPFLSGSSVRLDPHKLRGKKKETIGLFPKL